MKFGALVSPHGGYPPLGFRAALGGDIVLLFYHAAGPKRRTPGG